jgi:cell division cycle 20-like protein 1 (cofactor of APC complex)
MIASGGNDNKLFLFSLRTMGKMMVWDDHKAAVKAIGFNPRHPTIATGGGTADRKLRIFSLQTF